MPKLAPRSVQAHLDRIGADPQQFPDLGGRPMFQIMQHDHLAVARRQRRNRLADLQRRLVPHHAGIGRWRPAWREPRQHAVHARLEHLLALVRAAVVQRDHGQPCPERRILPETICLSQHGQKNILHHVVDVASPPQEAIGEPGDARLIELHELLEGAALAAGDPAGKIGLVGINQAQPADHGRHAHPTPQLDAPSPPTLPLAAPQLNALGASS